MKRVLIFSLAYYPHVGGAEVAIKEITDRLASRDMEFHLIAMRMDATSPAEEVIGGVRVFRIGGGRSYVAKALFPIAAALEARRLHTTFHYDACWAMMLYMTFPLTLLRMAGLKLPYVLTLQEGDPLEHVFGRWRIRLFSPLLRSGIRHATLVQTISTFLARWAKQGGYCGEIVVIPNGVDVARFAVASSVDIGKKEGERWLTHTGRLVHKNALDTVLRALPLLPADVHFLSLGDGPDKQKLEELAKNLGVQDRVRFVSYVDISDVPKYLHAADIFIRPSRSEGMGNSFIEAMAAGVPVIATQEGGIADFLFDAKRNPDKSATGWAVDKDSPEQIAKAVKDILANPEDARLVTKTAQEMVVQKYDWDIVARAMREKVFARVLKTG